MTAPDTKGRCSGELCWYSLPLIDGLVVAHSKAMTLDNCEGSGRPPVTPGADRVQRERVARALWEADSPDVRWEAVAPDSWLRSRCYSLADAALAAARPNDTAAETQTLRRAREILTEHGHGIGAACLPPCFDPARRAARLAALGQP